MNIFKIMNCLYTKQDTKWMKEVNDTDSSPYVIQRWLVTNKDIQMQVRWLDKYATLPLKMYLSLAWSTIPKSTTAPSVSYIKKIKETSLYSQAFLKRFRQKFEIADNDFDAIKPILDKEIYNCSGKMYSYFGDGTRGEEA